VRRFTNILPVLTPENEYVDYYEIQDIIRFFLRTPFLKRKGETIIVEKNGQGILYVTVSKLWKVMEPTFG
jgi:hypothetical protein